MPKTHILSGLIWQRHLATRKLRSCLAGIRLCMISHLRRWCWTDGALVEGRIIPYDIQAEPYARRASISIEIIVL